MANKRRGTIYVGMTSDINKRVWEHKNDVVKGFTKKYGCHTLVYFESTDEREVALQREKNIKAWNRQWKVELIEKANPSWLDLSDELR